MASSLKRSASVIESLRTVRRADESVAKLGKHSFEEHVANVSRLVANSDWRFGPATLVSTHVNSAIAKTADNKLVRVEWTFNQADGAYKIGNAKVIDSSSPASDLGTEVFESARAAVHALLDHDDNKADMINRAIGSSIEEIDGELQRRLMIDIALRTISRAASWHEQVEPDDVTNSAMPTRDQLVNELSNLSLVAESSYNQVPWAQSYALDLRSALVALLNVDNNDEQEVQQVVEAVASVSGYFTAGARKLKASAGK